MGDASPNTHSEAADGPARSTGIGVAAALAPLLAVGYALATLIVLTGGLSGLLHGVGEAGVWGYLVLLSLPLTALVLAPLLFFVAGRGFDQRFFARVRNERRGIR